MRIKSAKSEKLVATDNAVQKNIKAAGYGI